MTKKEKNQVCNFCFKAWIKKKATAHAAVRVVSNKKILLLQRACGDREGKWELPSGFIDRGETPQKAAIRELREETEINTLMESELHEIGTFTACHGERTDIITTFVAYKDDVDKEIKLEKNEEHHDHCWHPLITNELREQMVDTTKCQIDRINKYTEERINNQD